MAPSLMMTKGFTNLPSTDQDGIKHRVQGCTVLNAYGYRFVTAISSTLFVFFESTLHGSDDNVLQ